MRRFFSLLFGLILALPAVAAADDPLTEAIKLDRQGFIEETVPLWNQFLATHPEARLDVFAHIKLCIALSKLGQLGEAMELAQKLGKRYPDDFHAQFNLGNMTSAVHMFPEAVAAYETVVKLKPDEGLSQVGLGLTLFGNQKTERSLDVLRDVRTLFKKQKNISWYQNVRIMIGQLKSFAPYPPDFSNLWLTNNLKTVYDTYHRTLFLEFQNELGF